jgi:6-phosphogluconate dehydrogenase (decarboxylating)
MTTMKRGVERLGRMAANADGLNILKHATVGEGTRAEDAEFQHRVLSAMRFDVGDHLEKDSGS